MTRGLRTIAALLFVAPLSACGMLNSESPLIEKSDPAPELAPGTYQMFNSFPPYALAGLTPEQRTECIDPGYQQPDGEGGAMVNRLYCPFDTDDGDANPPFQVEAIAGGYRLSPKIGAQDKASTEIRLRRLQGADFALQLRLDGVDPQLRGYAYFLARARPPLTEIFVVPCDDGSALAPDEPPRPKLKCTLTALAPVRPDLIAYAAEIERGKAIPPLIVKRIGD